MSLLSRAVAKIKDALVFLSQKAAGIGQADSHSKYCRSSLSLGSSKSLSLR
jgi:hypothetical protein